MKRKIFAFAAPIVFCAAVFAERPTEYISPNNDGVKDSLSIPLRISDKRYIVSWTLTIKDESGAVVRTIGNKEALPSKVTFKSFFKQLVTPKRGVEIPSEVVWNGVMDSGENAPDGVYHYCVSAKDDNGNEGVTDDFVVVVDTVAPEVEIAQNSDKTFGEGDKAEFVVSQSGSVEDEWNASFTSADGKVARSYTWRDTSPKEFRWNGTDENGMPVSDGVYSYEITATDRAGNTAPRSFISNIIFSADKPAANIAINGSRYFSPGTPSEKKSVSFDVSIPEPNQKSGNRLTEWAVSVVDKKGAVLREWNQSQSAAPPSSITFDGAASNGKRLPDGEYQARVAAKYLNGYETKPVFSPVFTLDTSKPEAKLSVSDKIFGAGSKSSLAVTIAAQPKPLAPVESWRAVIAPADDPSRAAREYDLGAFPPGSVVWDGFDDSGNPAPNGKYVFTLLGKDMAGNESETKTEAFTLDMTEAVIALSSSATAFAPGVKGARQSIRFTPAASAGSGGVAGYSFSIRGAGGVVYKNEASGPVPKFFDWDGRALSDGAVCADGEYAAVLEITGVNGSKAQAAAKPFVIDTVPPSLSASVAAGSFAPGAGGAESAVVSIDGCSSERLWTAEVRDASGAVVRRFSWNGVIKTDGKNEIAWNGADESGNTARDGVYSVVISSTDDALNSFSTTVSPITLDTRETKAFVTAEHEGISPNGDGVLDAQAFALKPSVNDSVSSWSFDICDEKGVSIRSWSGEGAIPARIEWDGMDSSKKAGEGTFSGRLRASYKNGKSLDSSSAPFVCTATPPVLSVDKTPRYFSPDNDGADDDLFLKLKCSTKARVASWSFVIDDPRGRAFWKTGGKNSITERIVWDGLSNTQKGSGGKAERVQSAMDYPFSFRVSDNLGMSSEFKGIIPVDVLVVRDGSALKMAVPSIIFRSDNADFNVETAPGKKDGVTAEQAANNERVLKRIAEVLNKFKDYKVTIVGHANRATSNEAEETEDNPREWGPALIPLSERRAQFVKDYLAARGVGKSRLATEGKGGTQLLVDWQDKDNNWKNRRVEFILRK